MRKHYRPMAVAALLIGLGPVIVRAQVALAAIPPSSSPILAGCEPDYPPYCIVAPDGRADGFSVELLRASLQAVGLEPEFKTAPWAELKQDLAEGRLRVLPLVGRTPEREALYDFTFPYLTMHGTIAVRNDNADIQSPSDLKGKQVAVLQGDNAEEYLRRTDLGAKIIPLPSFETALRDLSAGKHDAVVIQKLLAFQLMQQAGLTNLVAVGPSLYTQNLCFAVRKGDAGLLAALNEGLSIAMANGTFRTLHAQWFADIEAAERTKSRIVVGGDSDYPPYEFLDRNGQPTGFNVDLTRAIARHLGLSVDIRLGKWGDIRKGLEVGEIDAVQWMFYSAERDRSFEFSPPSTHVQHVIVVRAGSPEPADLKALSGKSVFAMAGDIMEDLVAKQSPKARVLAVASQEEALRRLASGEGDCALVAKVPARYWIRMNGWRNLKILTPPVLSAEYCYAVPGGRHERIELFTEGLAALKATGEYRQIQSRWLGPYEAPGFSLRKLIQIVLLAILPLLVLLLAAILWSRTLQRRVVARTRALSFNLALLNARSEASIDGILVVDENGRILSYTRRFVEMWGLQPELVKQGDDAPVLRCVTDQLADPKAFLDRVQYLYGHKRETSREEIVLKDGRTFDRYSAPIFGEQDRYYGRVWFFRDVTDRKQAEAEREKFREQVHQMQKIESIGRLAGGVAHDFNNMLQAILGHVELALDQVPPEDRLQRNLLEIRKAAERSADLTRQLLAFARKQTASPKVLDLNGTIEDMLQILRRLIGEHVDLAWMPGRRLGPVKMDPSQIGQILTALCVNARDAMPGGGNVAIETSCAAVGDEIVARHPECSPGDYVVLAVRDNGQGMDAATLGKIFEPFFTTKGMGQGTGLGLATVYGIVQQNRGFIEAESEPGRGTFFRIYLPQHVDQVGQPAKPKAVLEIR